jgi:hypothetical protein
VEAKRSDPKKIEMQIFLFRNNLNQYKDDTMFGISEIIVHPDWNALNPLYEADIAIAILEKPVEFSSEITNICLNTSRSDDDNLLDKIGIVCGWGYSEFSNYRPVNDLRAVTVRIVDQQNCNESQSLREIYAETLFCAGNTNNAAGPCKGDTNEIL